MFAAISGTNSFLSPNLVHMRDSNGKLSVPVSPYIVRSLQFKHIVGIPAGNDAFGVPVSKLIALDNLIDKLVNKKTGADTISVDTKTQSAPLPNASEKPYINQVIAGNIKAITPDMGVYLDTWA